MSYFVPITPAGTPVIYGTGENLIAAKTREQAIKNLLKAAAHLPYSTWENFEKRGYTIEEWEGFQP